MTRRRLAIGAAIAVLIGLSAWVGYRWWDGRRAAQQATQHQPTALDEQEDASNVTMVQMPEGADPSYGATPMAERVAVLGLLNKRNGQTRDVTLKPGQATRIGDVIIRLRACERTAPWEDQDLTGAFVQLDVKQLDNSWRRVFSGWLYKERPALNVVQHPIYDVWPKSCAMTFPEGGPNSTSAGSAASTPAPSRSSAPKSAPTPAAPQDAPETPATATSSNAM